jgi:hypothetical protein
VPKISPTKCEVDRGLDLLRIAMTRVPEKYRDSLLANCEFYRRCFASYWISEEAYSVLVSAAVDEVRLQLPEEFS